MQHCIFVGKKLCELDVVMQNSVAISLYVYSASVTLVSNNCNGKERVARPVFFSFIDRSLVNVIVIFPHMYKI